MPVVYNIHVEEYNVRRVMRQFRLYQESLLPVAHSMPAIMHKYVSTNSLHFRSLAQYQISTNSMLL